MVSAPDVAGTAAPLLVPPAGVLPTAALVAGGAGTPPLDAGGTGAGGDGGIAVTDTAAVPAGDVGGAGAACELAVTPLLGDWADGAELAVAPPLGGAPSARAGAIGRHASAAAAAQHRSERLNCNSLNLKWRLAPVVSGATFKLRRVGIAAFGTFLCLA